MNEERNGRKKRKRVGRMKKINLGVGSRDKGVGLKDKGINKRRRENGREKRNYFWK